MRGCSRSAWAAGWMQSTSSIRAVAVVVSIGLDHQEFLGSTLEDIAREKAGIFRRGVPAVLGSRDMPDVLERTALELGAPLKRLGREYDYAAARGPLALSRCALGLAGSAAAGASRRDAISQCRRRPGGARGAISGHRGGARGDRAGTHVGAAGGALPGDRDRRTDLHPGRGAQPGRGRGARARIYAAMPNAGRTLAVCGILGDKDAAGVAAALADCIDEWWLASTEGARGTSGTRIGGANVGRPRHRAHARGRRRRRGLAPPRRPPRAAPIAS